MDNQSSNQNNTQMNAGSTTTTTATANQCANCGMQKEDWRGNNGQGFQMGDKTYCCQGCATGTGCTCG